MSYNDHYRRGGFGYDKDIRAYRRFVADHYIREFALKPGTKLLDVGCGDGFWSMLFDEKRIEVAGFDTSEGAIEMALKRLPHRRFVVASVAKPLPFETGYFDVAFMRGLTTFNDNDILERAAAVLPNIVEVVRPGGMLLLSTNTTQVGVAPAGTSVVHLKASAYVQALETVAQVRKLTLVDNALQVAAYLPARTVSPGAS